MIQPHYSTTTDLQNDLQNLTLNPWLSLSCMRQRSLEADAEDRLARSKYKSLLAQVQSGKCCSFDLKLASALHYSTFFRPCHLDVFFTPSSDLASNQILNLVPSLIMHSTPPSCAVDG